MTPPSLTVAREILASAAKHAGTVGNPTSLSTAAAIAAIEVVLAALDQRPAAKLPPLWQAVTRKLLIAQHPDETDDQFRDRVLQWRHAFEGDLVGELASDSAEIAACTAAAGGDRGSDERLSEYIARLRRTAYAVPVDARPLAAAVPVHDSDGRKVGHGRVEGDTFVVRITDEHTAAAIRASTGPRRVSIGYMARVEIDAIAEPAPGAPRVLCGLPVDGESCCLGYGHDGDHEPHRNPDGGRAGHPQVNPGPMSAAERAAALRADADRIEATAARCSECGAALPLSPGRPGCAECWAPTTAEPRRAIAAPLDYCLHPENW